MFTIKTKLDKSNISGIGVFSEQIIPKGYVIWQMTSISVLKITLEEYTNLSEIEKQFIQEKDYYWIDEDGNYMLPIDDSRFVNHSSNPNIIETENNYCVASRDININEELTIDYKTLVPKKYWKEFML